MQNSKRQKVIKEKIEELKAYSLSDAIKLLQSLPKLKFNESIDLSVNLGVDPKHADQIVRGVVSLPNGTGKKYKIAVFAKDDLAKQALDAGADLIMLDNMSLEEMRDAVLLVNGKTPLECSGGVTLRNIKEKAETGVNFISVGAITQSANCIDIGLDF